MSAKNKQSNLIVDDVEDLENDTVEDDNDSEDEGSFYHNYLVRLFTDV